MVAGLEEVSGGRLLIDGALVNDVAPSERDVAMVFQSYALYPHMTIRDNLGFALRLKRTPKDEIRRPVDEAAELLDLTGHLDRRPGQLSGGQRQRVAMGRAMVREPVAFLMGEPLSNLDAKLRVEMRIAVARLQRRLGTTMVYVTHDQTEAMTLGDRVGVMRGGVLQQVAPPETLYAEPANRFVAGFIGSPQMNFVAGTVVEGAVRTGLGAEIPAAGRADGPVVVGIRPESFGEPGEPGIPLRVDVETTERLGADAYLHFRVAGEERLCVARVDGSSLVRGGEVAELVLDARGVHLFDAQTDARLV